MRKENVLFLTLSIITVICIMAIGVAIAERSILIAVIAFTGIFIAMRLAFILRKKRSEYQDM